MFKKLEFVLITFMSVTNCDKEIMFKKMPKIYYLI